MANALQQQMADDIASLVRKQTFAGSGVWRQSGNATLRIQTQTNSIVEALQRIPSREEQEEEERESDRQHAELIGALEGDSASSGGETKKKGGLLGGLMSGIGAIGKGLGKSLMGVFKFLKNISSIFKPLAFLLKPIAWLGGVAKGSLSFAFGIIKKLFFGLSGLAALFAGLTVIALLGFDPESEEDTKKALGIDKDTALTTSNKIAGALGKLASNLVDGVMNFWNEYAPPGYKVDADTQKKFTDTTFTEVTKAINNVLDFATKIKDEFVAGFDLEGVTKSFNEFKTAIGKAWDSIDGSGAGKATKDTLLGVANVFGSAVSGIVKTLANIATGIANLIANPTETLARIQANIEDFFFGIGQTIGRLFDKFFNFEFILTLLPQSLQDAARGLGLQKRAAEKRFEEKKKEIDAAEENIKTLEEANRINEERLKEEQAKGDEADKTKLRNLSLNIQRNKNEIEREEENIEYAQEAAARSRDNIIQEEVNDRFEKATNIDRLGKLEDIKDREDEINEYMTTSKIGSVAGGYGATVSQARQLKQFVDAGGDISSSEGIALMQELGFKKGERGFESNEVLRERLIGKNLSAAESRIRNDQAIITRLKNELKAQEADLIPRIREQVMKEMGLTRQTGGPISATGSYRLHAGEMVMDNIAATQMLTASQIMSSYLPQSGAMINGLQMERTMGGTTGSAAPVVIDNSQQPTIINQTNVAAPQTRGPALVGEGRDKVNMR